MDLIAQITALVTLLGSILGLFLKLRGIEKDMEKTIDKRIKEKNLEQDKLQVERDKLSDNKMVTVWKKVNGLDTQINGNPENDTKGLALTVEMLKLTLRKNDDES